MNLTQAKADALRNQGMNALRAEMVAAGHMVANDGFLLDGSDLYLVLASGNGTPVDVPGPAQAVVTAHTPPAAIDYSDAADITALEQVRAYVDVSRTFLANGAPTNPQVLAQVQRNTRAIMAIIRRLA